MPARRFRARGDSSRDPNEQCRSTVSSMRGQRHSLQISRKVKSGSRLLRQPTSYFAPSGSGAGRCSEKRNQSADMATVFLLKKCHRRIRFFGVLQRQSHDQPPFAKTLPRSCDLISANRAASITRPRRKFTRSVSLLRYMSQSGRCVDQHARSAKRRSAL